MPYEFKIGEFHGPLHKLLELIEGRKLSISAVSLAEVTNDFLKYIEGLQNVDFSMLADFIAVASRLILIKSKFLLPDLELTPEEESDVKNLESRLRIYQEFKTAQKYVETFWKSKQTSFSRPYFFSVAVAAGVFSPGNNLNVRAIAGALGRVRESLERFTHENETISEKIISLEEKIAEVVERISKVGEASFKKLFEAKNRSEIIVLFLAVLHLARERLICLEQESQFADIKVIANKT